MPPSPRTRRSTRGRSAALLVILLALCFISIKNVHRRAASSGADADADAAAAGFAAYPPPKVGTGDAPRRTKVTKKGRRSGTRPPSVGSLAAGAGGADHRPRRRDEEGGGGAHAAVLPRAPRGRTSPNFVVLLTCSDGFRDMWINWIRHFERLRIAPGSLPVRLFAEDRVTYDRCLEDAKAFEARVNVTCLSFESVFPNKIPSDSIAASGYNSEEYKKMMSQRPAVVLEELRLGHDVIFADVDTVWLKNPVPYYGHDFALADSEEGSEIHIWGQKDQTQNYKKYGTVDYLCAGNVVLKSCDETIALIEQWRKALVESDKFVRNQPLFNKLLAKARIDGIHVVPALGPAAKRKVVAKTLPTELFPSGALYFGEEMDEEGRKNVVVVHNNYVIGYEKKVKRFKKFGLWLVDQ